MSTSWQDSPWSDPERRKQMFALAQATKLGGYGYATKPRMRESEAVLLSADQFQLARFNRGAVTAFLMERQSIVSLDFFTEADA